MRSLRVLDLGDVMAPRLPDPVGEEPRLPDSVGELIHLKFLRFNFQLWRLPSSICNLKSLQTLEFSNNFPNQKLPPEIFKLEQLRHLRGYFEDLSNIDSLINLQTLSCCAGPCPSERTDINKFINTCCLTRLVNLRKLIVFLPFPHIRSLDLFAKLESLETLILLSRNHSFPPLQPLSSSTRLLYLHLYGAIDELPASSSFPESLASLILSNSKFKEDPMPMLEGLPNLRSLELIRVYQGNKIVCSASGFRQLEVIRISNLGELEEWQVEEGAMPVIKGWHIHGCNKLKIIPERLKSVPMVVQSTYADYGGHFSI